MENKTPCNHGDHYERAITLYFPNSVLFEFFGAGVGAGWLVAFGDGWEDANRTWGGHHKDVFAPCFNSSNPHSGKEWLLQFEIHWEKGMATVPLIELVTEWSHRKWCWVRVRFRPTTSRFLTPGLVSPLKVKSGRRRLSVSSGLPAKLLEAGSVVGTMKHEQTLCLVKSKSLGQIRDLTAARSSLFSFWRFSNIEK